MNTGGVYGVTFAIAGIIGVGDGCADAAVPAPAGTSTVGAGFGGSIGTLATSRDDPGVGAP
jgi:hypothetical protein